MSTDLVGALVLFAVALFLAGAALGHAAAKPAPTPPRIPQPRKPPEPYDWRRSGDFPDPTDLAAWEKEIAS